MPTHCITNRRTHSRRVKYFPISITLSLQLAALALLREPVSARDLVRWCLLGSLPYFGAESFVLRPSELSASVSRTNIAELQRFFNPQSIWKAQSVHYHTAHTLAPCFASRCVAAIARAILWPYSFSHNFQDFYIDFSLLCMYIAGACVACILPH